jgi:hypothetical protein
MDGQPRVKVHGRSIKVSYSMKLPEGSSPWKVTHRKRYMEGQHQGSEYMECQTMIEVH